MVFNSLLIKKPTQAETINNAGGAAAETFLTSEVSRPLVLIGRVVIGLVVMAVVVVVATVGVMEWGGLLAATLRIRR